jgi:kinesin family protein 5
VLGVLEAGDSTRAVASTNMNAVSSRSHSVFMITVDQENTEGSKKSGRLNLVDLAGTTLQCNRATWLLERARARA